MFVLCFLCNSFFCNLFIRILLVSITYFHFIYMLLLKFLYVSAISHPAGTNVFHLEAI